MRALALGPLALALCNPDPGASGLASGPTGLVETLGPASSSSTDSSSTTASSTTSTSSSTSSTEPGSSGAPWPDAGPLPDFGDPQPIGCKGKIDFLFAISRFYSMGEPEQKYLPGGLDGLITAIKEDFADFDSHILVANPDGEWTGTLCESQWCPKYGNCGPDAPGYVCGSTYDSLCDIELGAGILFNAGYYATNHKCELAGGRRYIVTKEEPDLLEQFKCISRVGTSGDMPPMMKAIATAVSPELNAEDGCNAGFLRPDALLVIVMIMDMFDYDSPQGPTVYYNKVLESKGGDPDAIVMVDILPPEEDCDGSGIGMWIHDPRLFAEKFPHRVSGVVCGDFSSTLAEAATVVRSVCDGFIPQ
jgi:hypothetical protein